MKSNLLRQLSTFVFLSALVLGPPRGLRAGATWPTLLNYQGHLNTAAGNAVTDGPYTIVFTLYTAATAGTQVWQETQTVQVTKGLFNAVLGSVTSLATITPGSFSNDLWLGVKVGTDAEMTPRQQLLQAAYAENSQTLLGLVPGTAATNLVELDGSGKIPAGLVQNGSLSLPLVLSGASTSFALNVSNTTNLSTAQGLIVSAPIGVFSQATDPSGYGIWGQTSPTDNATAVGLRASSSNGMGLLVQSSNGIGISTTSQSTTSPSLFSAGAFPAKFLVNTSASNNAGVMVSTVSGDKTVNLADHGNNAGVFVNVNASGIYGVSSTASASTGIYGSTFSPSATDYGIWGSNLGNATAGVGVYGTGFYGVVGLASPTQSGAIGVQGWSIGNAGHAVEGDVSFTATGANFAVMGNNYLANGTAIFGRALGGTGGVGVRGGITSGTGGIGIYGAVSSTSGAVGAEGFTDQPDGFGVVGVQGVTWTTQLTSTAGVEGIGNTINGVGVRGQGGLCGVCAFNTTGGIVLPNGVPNNVGLYANSFQDAILAESTNAGGAFPSYGVYADTQSTYAGTSPAASSAAGYFVAEGASNGPNTAIFAANYSNNATSIGIYSTGYYGVWSAATGSNGSNFYSDGTNQPAFGFFHYGGAVAPAGGIGVSAEEDCNTCYGGQFTNTLATNGAGAAGAALDVNGRIKVNANTGAGTFVVPVSAFASPYTFSNSFITVNCLIFMTPEEATPSTAAVTSLSPGQAIITFTPNLTGSSNFTYQYLIIGQ